MSHQSPCQQPQEEVQIHLPDPRQPEVIQLLKQVIETTLLSAELEAPLLGQVPLDPRICNGGNTGQPLTITDATATTSQIFIQIAAALERTFLSFSGSL